MPSFMSAAVWLLALELIGLATLPLALRVFYALPDRGYAFAKILGLLVVAYVAWLTAILGLTAFSGATIVVLILILGAASWALWGGYVLRGWREVRALALGAEAVFLATFLGAALLRAYSPAIAGQEKQMDHTFLHSLIRAQSLPAEDFWLAGYAMPYYYFGYLTQSILAKITPIDPAVAYNLAMVTVLALAALGAFGLGAGLIRMAGGGLSWSIGGGVAGAVALTVMGNLQAFFEWLASTGIGDAGFWGAVGVKNLQAHNLGFPPSDGSWWFRAARVIPNIQPDGITEFPFFSFILNDLHPHYMAIPLGVLIVALAVQQLAGTAGQGTAGRAPTSALGAQQLAGAVGQGTAGRAPTFAVGASQLTGTGRAPTGSIRAEPVRWGATAVVLGAVIPSNTWDVPVLWGAFALALLACALRRDGPLRESLVRHGLDLAAVLGLAVALYLPYFVGYVSQPLGIGLVLERTYFGTLLVLFGPLVVLPFAAGGLGAYAAWARARAGIEGSALGARILLAMGAAGLVALLTLLPFGEPTLGFLLACLAFWLPLTWQRARAGAAAPTAAGILTILGLGSILVAEVVFLRDVFGTRMNTVFKFYYDAWILLALAAPFLAWELVQGLGVGGWGLGPVGAGVLSARERKPHPADGGGRAPALRNGVRAAGGAGLAIAGALAVAGLLYPLTATHARSGGFASAPTLDGMSYLRAARPDDAAAIEWLRQGHAGVGVVEAVGNDYTDAGRFSTFGGAPTLVGWAGHEVQWRGPNPEIERRRQLAQRVYTDPDGSTWRALQQLGMGFVAVGGLEREVYGPDAAARLQESFPVAHRTGSTTVYALGTAPQAASAR